jgi:hypothetical protein
MSTIVDTLITRIATLELITDRLESISFGPEGGVSNLTFKGVDGVICGSVYGLEVGKEEGERHIFFGILEEVVGHVLVSHPIRQLIADGVVREATPEEAIYGKGDEA